MEIPVVKRWVRLVGASGLLGLAIALLIDARLGADGYATLVNGLHRSSGVSFWLVNSLVGAAFVAVAWRRGVRPGPGTLVQPLVVGVVVSAVLPLCPAPVAGEARGLQALIAFVLLCVGVAGYLASDMGAGPVEAAAGAWEPRVPFAWAYGALQVVGALVGWTLGADVGPATLLVAVFAGPGVELASRLLGPRPVRTRATLQEAC